MSRTATRLIVAAIIAWVFSWAAVHESFAKKSDDTLVVAIKRAIRSVDRLYTGPREGLILAQLTDDGLFYVDPETLDYTPMAAKSYKWVDDKTLDVTIRANVNFHDGSPLTADDVVEREDPGLQGRLEP